MLWPSARDRLYRNDRGRFVDVTSQAGVVDADGRGLGVVAADFDGDSRVDLFIANDMTANFLFRNKAPWQFEEMGTMAGVAANADGGFRAGMGVACGDLDGDGWPDLAVTNFFEEATTLYQSLGHGLFSDRTAAVGLRAATRFVLGFGIAFLDVNNDGRLDLAQANGHISDRRPTDPFLMTPQLFEGDPTGWLTDISDRAGRPWQVPQLGRGLAVADLDNDGRLDLLIVSQDGPLAYHHNQTRSRGHFLTLRLEGNPSNRDAIGARVTVEAGGQRQVAHRFGGGSYLSASDLRLHFGLGRASMVDALEVRWPSGRVVRHHHLAADTGYLLQEADPMPRPLPGFSGSRRRSGRD